MSFFTTKDRGQANTRVGTFDYMAKEFFEHQDKPYTNKVDIFALGVVLYELVYGEKPYSVIGDLFIIN